MLALSVVGSEGEIERPVLAADVLEDGHIGGADLRRVAVEIEDEHGADVIGDRKIVEFRRCFAGELVHELGGCRCDATFETVADGGAGVGHALEGGHGALDIFRTADDLEGGFGDDAEGAFGADEELGHVVAGDVFDELAAGGDDVAIREHDLQPQHVV